MSTYPGEGSTPDDAQSDPTGAEPTEPVGYWERQAAEQNREQVAPGGADPTGPENPYAVTPPTQDPYGAQPGYPSTAQAGAHPYSQATPGVPGPPPYAAYSAPVPDHPQSTLALILGLVGLVGAFVLCGVTLVVSPFAWAVGHRAVKEIEASRGRLGGLSSARTGMILGIIGSVLLVLAILVVIGFVVLLVAAETSGTGSSV